MCVMTPSIWMICVSSQIWRSDEWHTYARHAHIALMSYISKWSVWIIMSSWRDISERCLWIMTRHIRMICVNHNVSMSLHPCAMNPSYLWRDIPEWYVWIMMSADITSNLTFVYMCSFICVPWFVNTYHDSSTCVWHDEFRCIRSFICVNSFICAHSFVCHDCSMTAPYVWHDSLVCVCDMARWSVCVTWLVGLCVWHE